MNFLLRPYIPVWCKSSSLNEQIYLQSRRLLAAKYSPPMHTSEVPYSPPNKPLDYNSTESKSKRDKLSRVLKYHPCQQNKEVHQKSMSQLERQQRTVKEKLFSSTIERKKEQKRGEDLSAGI
ncbi:hypothetical protein TNCT_28061 [Trichonephila clavata]|uniref:Uncharacterized protein n=1 Tax=Trichonephila clavata TaxID=2740835 RepID=A0A8X6FJN6_TRICU|nr:hypothetical protein TNCT_28061 [Trichonephila clavata]